VVSKFSTISIQTAGRMAGAVCDPADRGGAADLRLLQKDPMSAMPGMHHDDGGYAA
jgi:hypothetical protein